MIADFTFSVRCHSLLQKAGKRPSLVKGLKSTLVLGQPDEKLENEDADEGEKVAEQVAEGWLAYKQKFLEKKGIQEKTLKTKKVSLFRRR